MRHVIPWDGNNHSRRQRALCGEMIRVTDQVLGGEGSTCPECKRLDDQRATDLAALYDEDADLAQRQTDYGV